MPPFESLPSITWRLAPQEAPSVDFPKLTPDARKQMADWYAGHPIAALVGMNQDLQAIATARKNTAAAHHLPTEGPAALHIPTEGLTGLQRAIEDDFAGVPGKEAQIVVTVGTSEYDIPVTPENLSRLGRALMAAGAVTGRYEMWICDDKKTTLTDDELVRSLNREFKSGLDQQQGFHPVKPAKSVATR